ncbi:MraY family glycosyltransferase, partial [Euzebya pacifica]|uniref:glycosyltransferase family 4 protein n=1 Tax=Euzebya pacifica TaxID=1608957 RepID=UPI0030FB14B3
MDQALLDNLLIAVASLLVTVLATPVVKRIAHAVGAVKVPGDRHIHSTPTPELGGLAMLGGLVGAYAVANGLGTFDELFRTTSEPEAILLAALVIVYVGLIDDTRGLTPAAKLAGQILAAGTLVLFGVTLRFVYIPFGGGNIVSLSPDAAALLTIVLVVAMINAVNLVDGLDGLAAGIVAIAAIALFAYSELGPVPVASATSAAGLVLAAVTGACVGFLFFNFNPASIFMGDTGAMLLGLLMGAAGVSAIGNTVAPTSTDFFAVSVPALIPALVLAVPFIDTVLAIVRRVSSGQSIAAADKKHLHHRLLELGHSQRRAVLVLYSCSALLAAAVVGPSLGDPTLV